MKKILYYITDHGFGHTTRAVAIIRELNRLGTHITIRNSNVEYLNKALPTVTTIRGTTDVGPVIKKNGISLDKNKTLEKVSRWIDTLQQTANSEVHLIRKIKPDLIISDISAMPFIAE